MTTHDRGQRFSAVILVGLGGLLLVSGTFAAGQAAADGSWVSFVVIAAFMVVIGLGMRRGLRQLRPRRGPFPGADGDPDR
jgi:hypothetical protein